MTYAEEGMKRDGRRFLLEVRRDFRTHKLYPQIGQILNKLEEGEVDVAVREVEQECGNLQDSYEGVLDQALTKSSFKLNSVNVVELGDKAACGPEGEEDTMKLDNTFEIQIEFC